MGYHSEVGCGGHEGYMERGVGTQDGWVGGAGEICFSIF